MSNRSKKTNTTTITQVALVSALQCVVSPFAIVFPFSPVPVSFATLMLYISVYILGKKKGVVSCLVYLLIGLAGIPVFSGFTGGVGKVLGPTGGYMTGYLFLVFIAGWFVEKWNSSIIQGIGMLLGTLACYFFGSLWLAYQAGMSLAAAFYSGVLPFVPGDVIKIVIGVIVGSHIKKRLIKAGVL